MKKLFKTVAVTGLAAAALLGMASCGEVDAGETPKVYAKEDAKTVAVLKFGDHTSLNEIEDGVVSTINNNASDLVVKKYNCNFDQAMISQVLASIKSEDLACVVAIATPVAVMAANDAGLNDVPIVFAAVSDPEGSGVYGANITGTSDMMQLDKLVDLALEVNPNGNRLGYIYTIDEKNSQANAQTLEELSKTKKFSLTMKTIRNTAELSEVFNGLMDSGIDGLIVSDDNNVAAGMDILSSLCAKNEIGMYCAADSEVKDGGMMGYSISYSSLASNVGNQVLDIVKNRKAVSDVPVKFFDRSEDLGLFYNSTFLDISPTYKGLVEKAIQDKNATDLASKAE